MNHVAIIEKVREAFPDHRVRLFAEWETPEAGAIIAAKFRVVADKGYSVAIDASANDPRKLLAAVSALVTEPQEPANG